MIELPPYQQNVIVELLLSDGWLAFSSSKNKNARLGVEQSYSHKAYVHFVFSILSHYCNSLPVYKKRVGKGNTTYSIGFITRALPCFTELHSIFYVNNVKRIPHNIYELLTPVTLAHLIMGDGYRRGGLFLCTDSYTVQDVVRLQNVLIIRYNLSCSLRLHAEGHYWIYILKKSLVHLSSIVRPHMESSFLYKIGRFTLLL